MLANQKIKGLVFQEEGNERISEVFGLTRGQYMDLNEAFKKFMVRSLSETRVKVDEAEEGGRKHQFMEELEEGKHTDVIVTHTQALAKFIESPEFEKVGFELKTPNSYFMLGYMFHNSVQCLEDAEEKFEKMVMGKLPKGLSELLKDILEN